MKKIANVDWNQVLNDLKSVSSSGQSIVAAKGKGLGNYTFILDSAFAPGKPDAIAYVSTDKVDPVTGKFKVVIVNPVLQQFFKNYFQQHPNIKSYQDLTKAEFKEFKEAFLGEIANIILHEIAHMPEGGKFDPSKPGGGLRDEGYAKSQEKHASRGVIMKKESLKILNKLAKDLNSSGHKSLAKDVANILKKYAQDGSDAPAGMVENPGLSSSDLLSGYQGMDPEAAAKLLEFQRQADRMIEGKEIRLPDDPYTYYFDTKIKKFRVKTAPKSLPTGVRIAPPGSIIYNKDAEAYLKSVLDTMLGKVHFQYGIPMSSDQGPAHLNPDTGALMIGVDYDKPTGTGEINRHGEEYLEILRKEYDRYKDSPDDSGQRIAKNIKRWLDDAEDYRRRMDERAARMMSEAQPKPEGNVDPIWGPLNPPPKSTVTPIDPTNPENPWGYVETSTESPAMDKLSKAKVETDAIKKIAAMKEVYDQAMIFGEKNPFGRTNTKYKG